VRYGLNHYAYFRLVLLFKAKFKYLTSLPFTGPETAELLATAGTKMSLQEFEAPSGFRYVFKASDRQADGRQRRDLALQVLLKITLMRLLCSWRRI
jgi:hypothetical protein